MTLLQIQELLENNLGLNLSNSFDVHTGLSDVFIQYALDEELRDVSDLEGRLDEKFSEFEGTENRKLTDTEKERLKDVYADTLEESYHSITENNICPIYVGDWDDYEIHIEDLLADCYGAGDFINTFRWNIDIRGIAEDLMTDEGIVEFDGYYYVNENYR